MGATTGEFSRKVSAVQYRSHRQLLTDGKIHGEGKANMAALRRKADP